MARFATIAPFAFLRTRLPAGRTWREALCDPLLGIAAVMLVIALVSTIVLMVGTIVGLVASLASGSPLGHPFADPAWDRVGGMLLGIWALGVVVGGIGDLLTIVGTVVERRPFTPDNARRIERLAWRVIELAAIHWIAVPLGLSVGGAIGDVHVGIGDGGGDALTFALVLFVLARVFRQGNRLADEVEGTV